MPAALSSCEAGDKHTPTLRSVEVLVRCLSKKTRFAQSLGRLAPCGSF